MLSRDDFETPHEKINTFLPRDLSHKEKIPLRLQISAYIRLVRQALIHLCYERHDCIPLAPDSRKLAFNVLKSGLGIVNKIGDQWHPQGKKPILCTQVMEMMNHPSSRQTAINCCQQRTGCRTDPCNVQT